MEKIKCVVFDADNTLYSTRKIAKDADLKAMKMLADKTGKNPEDLYVEFMDIVSVVKTSPEPDVRHRRYSYSKLCEKYGENLVDEMYAEFKKEAIDKIEEIPGVKDILEFLKGKAEICVLTEDNKDMATRKLKKFGMLEAIDNLVTSDETGTMKPSIKYFGGILGKYAPNELLVVGDSYEKDLSIPEQLGMNVFLLDSPEKITELRKKLESLLY